MFLAADAELEHVALTDHDTIDGIERARRAASKLGLGFTPGVELSVDHGRTKIHLLVYFLEPVAGPLQLRLAELREGRNARNALIVERLCGLGYNLTLDDVHEQAAGPAVGRPHIADALIERGYFATRDEAFVNLLGDGGAAFVDRSRLSASHAIQLARESNAVPVIAHPVTMGLNRSEFRETFRQLTDLGLGGIEAHHPMHDPSLRDHITELASGLGIAATGGSDYHGDKHRSYRIGVGRGDLRVPASALDQLREQQRG